LRRIIVELSTKDIASVLGESPRINAKIKSIEFLNLLRSTPREITGIIRVKFKDPSTRFRDVFTDRSERVTILEKEGSRGYICFYSRRPLKRLLRVSSSISGGFLSLPYTINDGRVRATLLGSPSSIRKFISSLTRAKLPHKVVSLTDARFSMDSPLGRLTEKQQTVVRLAYRHGYYDLPRRIDSMELADKLGIRESTFIIHRRKAEKKLLTDILEEGRFHGDEFDLHERRD
jgi:predicted DNA binding protein